MTNIAELLLILALVAYFIVRRLAGQPLTAKRLFVVPLVIAVIGGYQLVGAHLTATSGALVAAEVVLGLGVGAVRGLTIDVYERGGHLWYRYRPLTIAIWVLAIALRVGVGFLGHALGSNLPSAALLVGLGATLLGEGLIVAPRARRTGVPYAPDRRTARAAADLLP